MTVVTFGLCVTLLYSILITNAGRPFCPAEEPELPLPLSAFLPSEGAAPTCGLCRSVGLTGLSSVSLRWGPGRKGLTPALPGCRGRSEQWTCAVAWLALLSGRISVFTEHFLGLSLGVAVHLPLSDWDCQLCTRDLEQSGEADHAADSGRVVIENFSPPSTPAFLPNQEWHLPFRLWFLAPAFSSRSF